MELRCWILQPSENDILQRRWFRHEISYKKNEMN
jgi:hypothetical protein